MMERLVTTTGRWLLRRLGLRARLALPPLLVGLSSVALGLAGLLSRPDTALLLGAAIVGVLLGWALARSPLPGWLAGLLALILGAEASLIRAGHLGRPLLGLLGALLDLATGLLRRPLGAPLPRVAVTPPLQRMGIALNDLLSRGRDWVAGGAPDPAVLALVWGLALWATAVWAGWTVRRRGRGLMAMVPAGVLLATGLSYARQHPYPLMLLMGATWMLVALTRYAGHQERWRQGQTDYASELPFDVTLTAGMLTLALTMVALLVPSISVRPVVAPVRRFLIAHLGTGERVTARLGLEPDAGNQTGWAPVRAPGLPRRHLLGAGPELSQQVVMEVYVQVPNRTNASGTPFDPVPNYYWRGLTYDRYDGHGWLTAETETRTYRAGEQARAPEMDRTARSLSTVPVSDTHHLPVRQEVRTRGSRGGLLYRAGQLVTADRDYQAAWRPAGDLFAAWVETPVYRVDSQVPVVSQAQLRAANGTLPEWVRARYLALPEAVPARVRALARDLTAGEATPYDRARAIERYLRTLPYTLDLPPPPPDRDVADYFLFDLRRGYCDYYATAMVVLARAAGLPARLVTGYASGTYDATHERYVVTAANAHSWVEIYFPVYGWIEFEPTAGLAALERPLETAPVELRAPVPPLTPASDTQPSPWRWVVWSLGGVLALLAVGGLTWWAADGWRLRRQSPADAVATLYDRLYHYGPRLEVTVVASTTPYEFAGALAERMDRLISDRRWRVDSVAFSQHVRSLTDLYVRAFYSPHPVSPAELHQAIATWGRLRRQMWLAWIVRRIP